MPSRSSRYRTVARRAVHFGEVLSRVVQALATE